MKTTAPTASARAPRIIPRETSMMTAAPHTPEMTTSGRPRCMSPWKRYGASPRTTTSPTIASAPVTTPLAIARRAK